MDNVYHLAQLDLPILTELAKLVNHHVSLVQDLFQHALTVLTDSPSIQTLMFVPAPINANMVKLYRTETVLEFVMLHLPSKMESVFSEDVPMDSKIMDMEDVLLHQLSPLNALPPLSVWTEFVFLRVEMDSIQIQTVLLVLLVKPTVTLVYQEAIVYHAPLDLSQSTDHALLNQIVQLLNSATEAHVLLLVQSVLSMLTEFVSEAVKLAHFTTLNSVTVVVQLQLQT
jgi:hypothetical protein